MFNVRGWGCLSTAPIIRSLQPERPALAGGLQACNARNRGAQPQKTIVLGAQQRRYAVQAALDCTKKSMAGGRGGYPETSARQPPQNRPRARAAYLTKPVEGANLGRACCTLRKMP